ncbi:MAG: ankyrin repeat domain-containing protein [Hydrogenimonas sp.]|nr:ankyrin repeat domain-containing protein [Hydrogenimonas sp.]
MNHSTIKIFESIKRDSLESLKELLEQGCDPNSEDEEGKPLLLIAIKSGASKEVVELLLEYGANLEWTTPEGVSLLDEAVECNRIDLAELFIEKGMDPSVTKRKSGMTVTMLAASFDYVDMLELLYEKGADIFAVDEIGLSAADYARKLGRGRARTWLEEKMANPF